MVQNAEAAIAETNSGFVAQGYYTSVFVLMDPDRATVVRVAEQTYRIVKRLGFSVARIQDVNTLEAWLGSLPGHGVQNVRRPLLNSLNLADLLPTSTIWAGADRAPCPYYPPGAPPLMHCVTTGSTPFRLNLHVWVVAEARVGAAKLIALAEVRQRRARTWSAWREAGCDRCRPPSR